VSKENRERRAELAAGIQNVSKDAPLKLDLAAQLGFPDGSMSASGLRREAAKGRLVIERIAGKDYTTLEAIEEMRKLCRIDRKVSDYGSEKEKEKFHPLGSSVTDQNKYALDAAMTRAKKLKGNSLVT
jgi:hypothetical protein